MEEFKQVNNRIVFLDYDGVVRHLFSDLVNDPGDRFGRPHHDLTIVKVLKALQDEFGFLFVCSSRAHAESSHEEQEAVFLKLGVHLRFHEDFRTPYMTDCTLDEFLAGELFEYSSKLPYSGHVAAWTNSLTDDKDKLKERLINRYRGFCVFSWLRKHPEVTKEDFLVIDDESDFFPIDRDNCIYVVNGELEGGFSYNHYKQMREFFLRKEPFPIQLSVEV